MRWQALLLAVVGLALGCHATPEPERPTASTGADVMTVLRGLDERSQLLQRLHGYGIVELRWTDADGDHFEQGDMEFWIDGPDRLAMRISKLGEPYFWIGTDGRMAWVFDLSGRPRRLAVDSMDRVRRAQSAGETSVLDTTRMLRAGLGMVPPPPASEVTSLRRGEDGTWWLETRLDTDDERRLRLHVASETWQPLRVELVNANGTRGRVVSSRARRLKRIEIPGRSSLGSPIVSGVMDIRDLPESGNSARFSFEGLSTDMADQPMDRVFDLEILKQALRPEIEEPLVGPGTPNSTSDGR
ncbi:MAG: hypothetical protein MK116_01330 [Phycisphaerales bacterium]|nr:hypothetical protein [Phycisphaerales bacterium]